jgi:GWxTD domain-containing protein
MRNIFVLFTLFAFLSCGQAIKNNLTVEEKEFLSKVRYIITKDEKKNFLSLSPLERKNFIEEFWKRRDPVPETEENEFKEEYFKRIEEANKLFGKDGWLQDRGMVYILLGPPTERYTYPMGRYHGDFPTEIWYYGFFPIVFVDYYWSGTYQLTPLSAYQIAQINISQATMGPEFKVSKIEIDFEVDYHKNTLQIKIPYKLIALQKKDSNFFTTISCLIKVKDERGMIVFQKKGDTLLEFNLDEIKNIKSPFHFLNFEIPLEKGKYEIEIELKNLTNNSSKKKFEKIEIK